MAAELIPPAVIQIEVTLKGLIAGLEEAKKLLQAFAATDTKVKIGVTLPYLTAAVKTAQKVVQSEVAKSPVQMAMDANKAEAVAGAKVAQAAAQAAVAKGITIPAHISDVAGALSAAWAMSGAGGAHGVRFVGGPEGVSTLLPVPYRGHTYLPVPYGGGGGSDLGAQIAAAAAADSLGRSGGGGGIGALLGGALAGGGGGGGGLLGALGWGGGKGLFGGLGGMASFGSILSLMGFGAEHVAATGVGIAGSMAGAGIGAGFLGLGALGTSAVGMGTDMAGIGQALNDTKLYTTAVNQARAAQSQYAATVQMFGANSAQAALALTQLQTAQAHVNAVLATMPKAAQGAIVALAGTLTQFRTMFDKLTGVAEAKGATIIQSLVQVGEKFLPVIGQFASENMTIIMKALGPFEKWLSTGKSGGLKIFTNLEKVFQGELPTGMKILTTGFELLAKTITITSKDLGPFITKIADFIGRMNGSTFSKWSKFVTDMVTSFHDWFGAAVSLGKVLFDLFRPAVGLGDDFAKLLTGIFTQIGGWLKGDHNLLHGLFTVHAKELITGIGAIIKAVLPLVEQFANAFIVFATGGAAVAVPILKAVAAALGAIEKIPFATTVLGWGAALIFFVPKVLAGLGALVALPGQIVSGLAGMVGSAASWAQGLSGETSIVVDSFSSLQGAVGMIVSGLVDRFYEAAASVGVFFSNVASGVVSFASSIGSMIAAGARWVATTAVQSAQAVASFAVMIARWVAGAAVFIAENVAMAASATAAFIAENAATLGIVAALAALVAGAIYVATHWKQVWGVIKSVAVSAWHFLYNDVLSPIKTGFVDAFDFVKAHLAVIIPILVTLITGPIGGIVAFLATHWATVKTDAINIWHSILAFFKGLPSQMLHIGEDIIHGLEHGITSAAGAVVNAAKHVASDIWHSVTSFFGIFSPSRLMATVGHTVVEGLSKGIRDAHSHIAAVQKVSQEVLKELKPLPHEAFMVGQSFDDQLAAGIRNNAAVVTAAVQGVVRQAMASAQASVNSSGGISMGAVVHSLRAGSIR